ncbi:MAG: asparaginase [Anaerolineae bacterium]|uniref:asparaginase n=1 Tax=Candidatus Amarolinea dominans TaxID=3140696 RepID=UPI003136AC18|nr:asparaginase [Anaerolineae bacterium]
MSEPTQRKPTIVVIATGGTIAMRIDPISGGPVPTLSGADLVAGIPALGDLGEIIVEEFANIPSEQMQPHTWLQLAQRIRALTSVDAAGARLSTRQRPRGIIILHGTDTMEETAFFLDVTAPTDVPVVLTGAMRAASDPDPDGPRNIVDAVTVAVHARSRGRGVLVVMNGNIHSARRVTKIDTSDVGAFQSVLPPDLGRIHAGRVHYSGAWSPRTHVPLPTHLPRVDIIPMYAGVDDFALKAALAVGAAGLVINAVGAGNVNDALFQGILQALNAGIPVVIASRVPYGEVRPVYAYSGGGIALLRAGAIFARDLNPQKARVLLMAGLGAGMASPALVSLFNQ